ncbi:hypothetical protein L2E82_35552 [Cichorium intybus]|uniref:Uncharacterized protein n=1 Tax=Cichorium intybus TaxID=13427 RepID=A0ACB9BP85_CICIN|nr:hypothetical protein L2E82_35552 [Cichorium intybus]
MLSISSGDEDVVDQKNTNVGGGKDDDKGNLLGGRNLLKDVANNWSSSSLANHLMCKPNIQISIHGDDEFWYMNHSDSHAETNHLTTGRAHEAYHEVLVTIEGILFGVVIPFAVIFTGGIKPLFWKPVVSIGAIDLPSYDIDLTPF